MLFNQNGKVNDSLFKYPLDDYENFKKKALKCERCRLRESCTQVVMGEGSLNNKIMFIGEGPGGTEDKKGRPFVGRAGRLLDKILKSVNIKRKNIYITNIVKCRPPENRNPTENEMEACSPILKTEIKYIKPKVIVPLGSVALKYLVGPDKKITEDRGNWFNKGELYFLPTFHPAYLLRNANMKKPVWNDFKKIKKSIERINELYDLN
ncbi:MAG TPA: uracil-DNA glycosylase [Halanaerobiales bacterium]|nr:uracil-DNA glycosylase [Halanaerobiales bacterium]